MSARIVFIQRLYIIVNIARGIGLREKVILLCALDITSA